MAQASTERRIARELETVQVMVGMYCRHHHGPREGLCPDCQALWAYARARVEGCPFRDDKPTCLACPVHCYAKDRREQIRTVMRFAGPRMALRHPLLALLHLLDGRRARARQAPRPPGNRAQRAP